MACLCFTENDRGVPFNNSKSLRQHDLKIYLPFKEKAIPSLGAPTNTTKQDESPTDISVCSVPKEFFKISEVSNYIDSILTLIIPFFMIAFFNTRIAITIWKLKDQRRTIVAAPSLHTSTNQNNNHRRNSQPYARHCTLQPCSIEESSSSSSATGVTTMVIYHGPQSNKQRKRNNICYMFRNKRATVKSHAVPGRKSNSPAGQSSPRVHQDAIEMTTFEAGWFEGRSWRERWKFDWVLLWFFSSPADPQPSITQGKVGESHVSPSRFGPVGRKKSTSSSEKRVTKTLLLVSLVFVLLNLPAHGIRCAQFIQVGLTWISSFIIRVWAFFNLFSAKPLINLNENFISGS